MHAGLTGQVVRLTRLRRVRERRALTQRELAEKAGLSRVTLVRIERGAVEPHPSTVRKLAGALGVAPSVLMDPPRRGATSIADRLHDLHVRGLRQEEGRDR